MKISVIVPTYQPANYLWECLDSLCRQTLAPEEFETVIVLNGCNEPYFGRIQQYIHEHPNHNFQLIQTEEGGVSNARNIGIDQSKGEYLSFLDDDDWITDNYLEELLQRATPEAIVHANVIQYRDSTGERMDYFLTSVFQRLQGSQKLTFFNARSFLSSSCCKLIPRKVIGTERFNKAYKLGEDSLFMFTISRRIRSIRMSGEDAIYYVRNRDNSASHKTYPYSYRLQVALGLTFSYLALFLRRPFAYNFPFFLTRVAATLRKLFTRKYE